MSGKKIRRMMIAMAEAHDAIVSEREHGAVTALRCGNGMATEYWRAIAKAARKSMKYPSLANPQGASNNG